MSNNYIEIKKFDIATLSNNQLTDLVGAIAEVNTLDKKAKRKLIESGLLECEGEYYTAKITKAHEGIAKAEIMPNWEKIIEFGQKNGKEIPMCVDYDKLASMPWVLEIANHQEFITTKVIQGKPYTGSVKVVKKEGK